MSRRNSRAFKRVIRARMRATGENHTTAMRALLAGAPPTRADKLVAARQAWEEVRENYGNLLAELPGPAYEALDQRMLGWIDGLVNDDGTTLLESGVQQVLAELSAGLLVREYLPLTREVFALAAADLHSEATSDLEDILIEMGLGAMPDGDEALSAWWTGARAELS